jgi:NAD-dependent deacetylase
MTDTVAIPAALAEALRDAHHVCVLTGAGISAESGVPTFREAQDGLWAEYDPLQLATPEGFLQDPELVWRWYRWRRGLVAEAQPNAAHTGLVELADLVPRLTLVTQNVDCLHQRAGSGDVIEFHGNLFADRCMVEGCVVDASADDPVPTCPGCGALVRPGVVWFGEAIPEDAMKLSASAASECDVFLSVGTSSLVFPAAGLVDLARSNGAVTVEINPEPTRQGFDFVLENKAGTAIPQLVNSLSAD